MTFSAFSVASDSPRKQVTPVQTPIPSLCPSPKVIGIIQDQSSASSSPLKELTPISLTSDDYLIVEDSDSTVSHLNLDETKKHNIFKEDIDFTKSSVLSSDIDLAKSETSESFQRNNISLDCCVSVASGLEQISYVTSNAVINSNNSSLDESVKTSSQREDEETLSSPDVNEDQEPVSLILDDPISEPDVHQHAEDDFYDYEAYQNPVECDSQEISDLRVENSYENTDSNVQYKETKDPGQEGAKLETKLSDLFISAENSTFEKWTISERDEAELDESDNLQNLACFDSTLHLESNLNCTDVENEMTSIDVCGETVAIEENLTPSENIIQDDLTINQISGHEIADFPIDSIEKLKKRNDDDFNVKQGINICSGDSTVCHLSKPQRFPEVANIESCYDTWQSSPQDFSDTTNFPQSITQELINPDFTEFENYLFVDVVNNQNSVMQDLQSQRHLAQELHTTIQPNSNFEKLDENIGHDDFGDFADFFSTQVNKVSGRSEDFPTSLQKQTNPTDGHEDDLDDYDDFEYTTGVPRQHFSLKESISRIENKNVSIQYSEEIKMLQSVENFYTLRILILNYSRPIKKK